jgi:spermidine/putrescine transport system permease protein
LSDATATSPELSGGSGAESLHRRVARWFRNPRGRPRFLALFTILYLIWSIVPILIAVRFSFNEGRSRSTSQGWSLRWYLDDPDSSVLHDPDLRIALYQSLKLAGLAIAIAVPLGVALAIGITRWRGRVAKPANAIALSTLITPEIVMGSALFLVFVHLFNFVELGTVAQLIGHVTFSIAFVLIIVRSRLISIGPDYEEAAMDLGASQFQSLRMALLPLLWPAIIASVIIVFAVSMDDFVISAFLSSGSTTDTVPVRIYSQARATATPALNALASLTLLFTLAVVVVVGLVWWVARRSRGQTGSTVEEFAKLEA